MLWIAILGALLLWINAPGLALKSDNHRGQAYQISRKPCWVDGIEGTCMFVFECIKSEGYHIGMCVDTFMFGSCCAYNNTDNVVLPQKTQHGQPSVLYTPPSQNSHNTKKPLSQRPISSNKSKPTRKPQTSLPRPNEDFSKNPTQPPRHSIRPMSTDSFSFSNSIPSGTQTKPGWQSTTEPGFVTGIQGFSINSSQSQPHSLNKPSLQWQATTDPGFVTRVKAKPNDYKPKPTKKPLLTPTSIKTTSKFGTKPPRTTTTTIATTITMITTALIPKRKPTASQPNIALSGQKPSYITEMPPTSTFASMSIPNGEKVGCGTPKMSSHAQTRIVGGRNAPFGRWPWQVSVRRTSFFGFSSTHRCGGAVLNENWIATAGHCVDDLLTSQIRIRVGEYDFSNVQEELPYVERGVAKKIVHPKYNFFTYEYDLALVRLDKSLDFAPHISPICLPASDDLLIGENATVTGWGRLSEGGTLPSVLQEVQVPIVSNDRCKSMFLRAGRHEFIPEIFLCAGHETGGQDSCQGDSGGPLQVKGKDGRYFLAGIISWGIGCAEANLPGVCTRISKFVPWILKNVT